MPAGISIAPNAACSTRTAMSIPIETESPASNEASENPPTPIRNIRLRPNRSARLPSGIISPASTST